jgi:hypothetical protein
MGDPAVVADGLEGLKRAGQVTFSLLQVPAGVSPLLRCTMASCRLAPGLPPAITKFPDAPVPRLD